ncbi:MAG TPA: aminotransferase class IV [Candidatus Nanoarchaeia archaeon]|nr:aminotransferase class IV [Candidatus Nanoarchaeia archaeon]
MGDVATKLATIFFYQRFSSKPGRRRRLFLPYNYSKLDAAPLTRDDLDVLRSQPDEHALHYGGNVFEGIRAIPKAVGYHGEKLVAASPLELALLNAEAHAGRFLHSMEALRLREPKYVRAVPHIEGLKRYDDSKDLFVPEDFDKKYLLDIITELIQRNAAAGHIHPEEGKLYVRPLAFRASRGDGLLGVYSLTHDIVFQAMVQEWGDYLPVKGSTLVVYDKEIGGSLRHVKAGANYADGQIAKNDAMRYVTDRGTFSFDDALYTDGRGYVLEATGANIFFMKDKGIITPSREQPILPGITREVAMELAKNMGYHLADGDIPLGEIEEYDCAFLTGTATGLCPVGVIYNPKDEKVVKFNQRYEPFLELQEEFMRLRDGREVQPQNQGLQQRVRGFRIEIKPSVVKPYSRDSKSV